VSAIEAAVELAVEVPKGNLEELSRWLQRHRPVATGLVILSLEEGKVYDAETFRTYVGYLNANYPRFAFVVVMDESRRVIVHIPADILKAWQQTDLTLTANLLRAISSQDRSRLMDMPGVRSSAIQKSAKLTDALHDMQHLNTDRVLVVDRTGRYVGVLERSAAVSEIVLALT
jgi:hypothetical protein